MSFNYEYGQQNASEQPNQAATTATTVPPPSSSPAPFANGSDGTQQAAQSPNSSLVPTGDAKSTLWYDRRFNVDLEG